jgi:Protein of unknown function (DUF2877)
MKLAAAASTALRPVLTGPVHRARWLGATQGAVYLAIPGRPGRPGQSGQPGALAVLAHDALRLPCGLVLATTSAELPLTALAPRDGGRAECVIGEGTVRWTGPAGHVMVSAVREWAPARAARGPVAAGALAAVRAALARGADDPTVAALARGADDPTVAALTRGADDATVAGLARGADDAAIADLRAGAVAGLVGQGPGLTPSGDDLLAGFLVGAHAFGLEVRSVREAVIRLAPAATTTLSAALLWHAVRGECIQEVAAFAAALTGRGEPGPAVERLLAVGHTSGGALARGVLLAAERAAQADAERAAQADSGRAAQADSGRAAQADSGRAAQADPGRAA